MSQDLKLLLIEEAAFYDAPMNDVRLRMFAHELAAFPLESVRASMQIFRREKGRRMMPMPGDIISKMSGHEDPRALGVEAASRVIAAVHKYGWNNGGDAREFIGSLGWMAVERLGGWLVFCESLGNELSVTTAQAQIRDLCEAQCIRGGDMSAPSLPAWRGEPISLSSILNAIKEVQSAGLEPVGDIVKRLTNKE